MKNDLQFWSPDNVNKMAATIDSHCEMSNGHIYQTFPPISIKFAAKCSSFQTPSFAITVILCEHFPLNCLTAGN